MLALGVALVPSPAGAHAELTGTSPQAGAVLTEPPDEVVLRFSEPVELAFATISVFDGAGERRDAGSPRHAGNDRSAVAIALDDLETGGYAVAWSVTSSDGHPIEGTFTFRVETPVPTRPPVLIESNPAPGSILEESPDAVVLTFDAPVESVTVSVFDGSGARVAAGDGVRAEGTGEAFRMPIENQLPPSGYVVGWQVVGGAAPTDGAFTFRIAGAGADAGLERLLIPEGGSTAVGLAHAIARWSLFLSLILLVGALVFLVSLWAGGLAQSRPPRLMWAAWIVAIVATIAGLAIQGPYASGRTLGSSLDVDVFRSVLSTRYGEAGALRVAVLAALGVVLVVATRRARRSSGTSVALRIVGGLLAVAAVATVSVSGHAASGSLVGLALVNDVAHLSAAAVWIGGLVVVWTCVLSRDLPHQGSIVVRFSRLAFWCVVVVLATGLFASWRQVGSFNAATSTIYGRVLLVKVGLFVVLIALAAMSRARVRRRWEEADAPAPAASALRRLVAAETALAVAILGVTALLVGAVPARSAESRPFEAELVAAEVERSVEVNIEPARAGLVDIHVYTFDSQTGSVAEVDGLEGRLQREGVGTLEIDFDRAGPGHFSAYGFDVPIAGGWVLLLEGEVDGEEFALSTPVEFR